MADEKNLRELAQEKLRAARVDRESPPSEIDGRRVVVVTPGDSTLVDIGEEVIGQRDPFVFDYSGRLVRMSQPDIGKSEVARDPHSVTLLEVSATHLTDRLNRVIRWKKWDARARDYVDVDAPRGIAEQIIARRGEWRHIRRLTAFAMSPTLRGDETLLDAVDFDPASSLFLVGPIPPGYKPPGRTYSEAKQSISRIEELLRDFPFESAADLSAAIAAILTAVFCRTVGPRPIIGVDATAPGTGKSTLVSVAAIVGTGFEPAVLAQGKDDAEFDKRFAGALLGGDQVISIDNVEKTVAGDLLCQASTQSFLKIRLLGGTPLTVIPTNSAIFLNGNQLDVRGDLRRRTILVRLDAKIEQPEIRSFTRDICADVKRRRGELLYDVLTLVNAYLAEGAPECNIRPFAGFERWSRWCRAPLVWLERADPLAASDVLRDLDPDLLVTEQFFEAWWAIFKDRFIVSRDLISQGKDSQSADLADALEILCAEHVSARRLGQWLRRHRGRVINGLRLESGRESHTKLATWRLINAGLRE